MMARVWDVPGHALRPFAQVIWCVNEKCVRRCLPHLATSPTRRLLVLCKLRCAALSLRDWPLGLIVSTQHSLDVEALKCFSSQLMTNLKPCVPNYN